MQDFGSGVWSEELFLGSVCPLPVDVLQVHYGGLEKVILSFGLLWLHLHCQAHILENGWLKADGS